MKLLFLTNAVTPHTYPVAAALYHAFDRSFACLECACVDRENLPSGWKYDSSETMEPWRIPYGSFIAEFERWQKEIDHADTVIAGAADYSLVRERIRRGRPVFFCYERPLKHGRERWKAVFRWLKWHMRFPDRRSVFLLSAGAYSASDFNRYGVFRSRAFQWGYFPVLREHSDLEKLMERKDPAKLLWAGRFLDWKHPEFAVQLAARLQANQVSFSMDLIGCGPMESFLREQIDALGLQSTVRLLGELSPARVRDEMERAGIFLFTSDSHEGWGAVVNEAMNSGCAVLANPKPGSVPYLLRHNENGVILPFGDIDALSSAATRLLREPMMQRQIGMQAYETIREKWNGEAAASRLKKLVEAVSDGASWPELFEDGPCSRAFPSEGVL